jgi:glycosyltransferase involved in cell wall biosynthesis
MAGVPNSSGSSLPRKSKVAIVAPSLRYVGGQAVQADVLMKLWKLDGEIEARWIKIDPQLPAGLRWAESVPLLRTILRQPIYLAHLWRGLKDVDVAHVFAAAYWSFLLAVEPAYLLAKARGKKVIVHYHSGEARDHLRRFRSARFLLLRADEVVVPSEYLVQVFREFGIRAMVIPNVVDTSQFQFCERSALRPMLVCTRGFHEYYCVDKVVEAFAAVQREFPEAKLELLGEGPLEGTIREQVAKSGITGVNFSGVASRGEMGQHYERADIFINASRLDNMPVSVIEAFRAGTVVVSTAPESMRFLVVHEVNGLLSKVGDAAALAANVSRLLREPELATRLAKNAYDESRKYTWPVVRGQWLKVYRQLTSEPER